MNIRIFQIDHDKDQKHLAFQSYQSTLDDEGKVNPAIYRQVYGGPVDCKNLENVFALFNTDEKVPGFYGESLSVSNVVEVTDGEFQGTYFCDAIGFRKIKFDIQKTVYRDDILKVLIVEPNKPPYPAEIRNDYHAMQSVVGGLISGFYPFKDNAFIFCNDDGKIIGLQGNRRVGGSVLAGTFFIVGDGHDGDCISLTERQIEQYSEMFAQPEQISQEEVQADMGFTIYSL